MRAFFYNATKKINVNQMMEYTDWCVVQHNEFLMRQGVVRSVDTRFSY